MKRKEEYKLTYYVWGKEINQYYDTYEEAEFEAYQNARNSRVFINDEEVYKHYKY